MTFWPVINLVATRQRKERLRQEPPNDLVDTAINISILNQGNGNQYERAPGSLANFTKADPTANGALRNMGRRDHKPKLCFAVVVGTTPAGGVRQRTLVSGEFAARQLAKKWRAKGWHAEVVQTTAVVAGGDR